MNKNKEFWYYLVQGRLDENTGAFANFYCYGDHCGDAFAKAEKIAISEGLEAPVMMATNRLDGIEDFGLPEDVIQVDSESYMLPSFSSYALDEEENEFIPPVGIAFGTEDGEYDIELIQEAFVAYDRNEEGIYEFELVTDHSKLIPTFFAAIEFLPSVGDLWIYLRDHWDDTETELWAGADFFSASDTIKFLMDHEASTLKNGFVDIVVLANEGETNLTLTEHKKIQLQTKNEQLFLSFIDLMSGLGFEQTTDYFSIEHGYHHWHYRPQGSLDKPELIAFLQRNQFERIVI